MAAREHAASMGLAWGNMGEVYHYISMVSTNVSTRSAQSLILLAHLPPLSLASSLCSAAALHTEPCIRRTTWLRINAWKMLFITEEPGQDGSKPNAARELQRSQARRHTALVNWRARQRREQGTFPEYDHATISQWNTGFRHDPFDCIPNSKEPRVALTIDYRTFHWPWMVA